MGSRSLSKKRALKPQVDASKRRLFSGFKTAFSRGLKAAKVEAAPQLKVSRLRSMGRREALARIAIGTGAVLTVRHVGKRKIPEIFSPQKRYRVSFGFLRHETREDAAQLRGVIEDAIRKKEQFHCIAIENALLRGDQTAHDQQKEYNRIARDIGKQFAGQTYAECNRIEREMYTDFLAYLKKYPGKYPEFTAQWVVMCARYGLQIKSAEWYNANEYQTHVRLQKEYDKSLSKENPLLGALLESRINTAPHSEQQLAFERFRDAMHDRLLKVSKSYRFRNDFLRQGILDVQSELRSERPDLKSDTIRVLFVSGGAHEKVFEDAMVSNHRDLEGTKYHWPGTDPVENAQTEWVRRLIRNPSIKIPLREMNRLAEMNYQNAFREWSKQNR